MSMIHAPGRAPSSFALLAAVLLLTLLAASTRATADWLVTRDGQRIETEGAWQMKGKAVIFTQKDGRIDQLPRDYINFEASQRVTRGEPPKIVMYATSWCPYCRRARRLLNSLDVEWIEKDIEKDREAAREFAAKSRGSGVPLIDFDGTLLRGFDQHKIRRLVAEVQKTARARQTTK